MNRDPGIITQGKSAATVHKVIRDAAVGIAHETYEALMSRNDWYKLWKDEWPELAFHPEKLEKKWVNLHWAQYIEPAKAALVALLNSPVPEVLKEEIANALVLDRQLVRTREAGTRIVATGN